MSFQLFVENVDQLLILKQKGGSMKALITGAHGFIGTHLVARLEAQDWEVVTVPRRHLGRIDLLTHQLREIKPDYIFHLAAYGNHGNQNSEETTFNVNVVGIWNLLQASKEINYKAFINVGSSSEYGRKDKPMEESDLPQTDTFYGASKVAGSFLARAFAEQFNKNIVTVRPFSVFGPGEADFRFIPTVIHNMIKGTEMPFVSWPEHDWIYIDDFIDGVLKVTSHAKELKGQVVNIGTGRSRTNKDVLTEMSILLEKGIKTKDGEYIERPHHSRRWVADNSLLKGLGWEEKVGFSKGILKTYEYYKEKYEK